MTINKSQGQSLQCIGLCLYPEVFAAVYGIELCYQQGWLLNSNLKRTTTQAAYTAGEVYQEQSHQAESSFSNNMIGQ